MPVYKINYFFKQRDWGWSETFYVDKATASAALVAANQLVTPRANLLGGIVGDGSSPRISEVRVSNVAIQRDSLTYNVPVSDGTPANPIGFADIPHTALVLRLESSDLNRRQLYMRGIPDRVVSENGIYVPDGVFTNQFNAWKSMVIAQNLAIYAVLKPPGLGTPIFSVTGFPGAVVATGVPHGLVDQDLVRIVSAPGIRGITGNWRVLVLGALTFSLLGAAASGVYLGGGYFYKRVFAPLPITYIGIVRASHRDTGRPFDAPRGRRRRRRVPA